MKSLIIAEKPSVALKIAANGRQVLGDFKLFGKLIDKNYIDKNEEEAKKAVKKAGFLENDKYIIGFAEGHLVKLYQAYDYNKEYKNWRSIPDSFIPDPFAYNVDESRKYLFETLSKLMKRSDVDKIINATDGDREGESIFRLIYNKIGSKKPVYRFWTSTHTSESVSNAFKNLKPASDYDNLGAAGIARGQSDWIMGALMTAKTTVALSQGKTILNVGRVQTAVIAEIVRVELLNRNYQKKPFYVPAVTFKTKAGETYTGEYTESFETKQEVETFIEILKNKKMGNVAEYKEENKNIYSPALYSQTALDIDMAKYYNIDPDATLNAAQSLYEHGYTTYPRTSSRYITQSDGLDFDAMYKLLPKINPLAKAHNFNISNSRIVDDSKVEGHPAIIPTIDIPNLSSLSENEKKVYEMVVKRAISVNFPAAIDERQFAVTKIDDYVFETSVTHEVKRGWREVYDMPVKTERVPVLKVSETVEMIDFVILEKENKPPQRYTKSSILTFMENCGRKITDEDAREIMKNRGLGTDATRPGIIKTLKDNGYITTSGKTIYPTDLAIKLIEILPVEELKSAEYTGNIEYFLYQVEKGEKTVREFMNEIIDLYHLSCNQLNSSSGAKSLGEAPVSSSNNAEESLGKCPLCGSDVRAINGKFGKFYSCSDFKNCKFKIQKICGKTLTENQVKKLLKNGETGVISGLKKKDGTPLSNTNIIIKNGEVEIKFEKK